MKPLKSLQLEAVPAPPWPLHVEQRTNIFDEYHFAVKLPNDSYFYENAILHLKASDPTAGKYIENLQTSLNNHNGAANLTQVDVWTALEKAMNTANLAYNDTISHDEAFSKILHILSDIWKSQYLKQLSATLDTPSSSPQDLLTRLNSWTQTDQGFTLILGPFTIFVGHNAEEKEKMMGIIKKIVVDETILAKIKSLEASRRRLEVSITEIRGAASKLSKAIEAEEYSKKKSCCPTFFKLVRNYFF